MNRWMTGLVALGGGLMAAPQAADAQVSVQVRLVWEWGDEGWRSAGPGHVTRVVRARHPVTVRHESRRVRRGHGGGFRVPRGHLPAPGYCRLWYPARPPGHQPPPRPCHELFRMHRHGAAVIIG
jgi:hypothetical protein